MQLLAQLIVSGLIVLGVLWFMWRLPRRADPPYGLASVMALGGVWAGVASVAASVMLWWVASPDRWITVVLLGLDPAALGVGVLVLWVYRGMVTDEPAIQRQQQQAWLTIVLGLVAVTIGYIYVMTHKQVFTPVGL